MIRIYRKAAMIQAEQFDGSTAMFGKYPRLIDAGTMCEENHSPEICLMGTGQKVIVGDWIVTGVYGEQYAITDYVFKQTYAELPIISKYVATIIEDYKVNHDMGALMYAAVHGTLDDGDWFLENMETACRAWLDGYQVEG